MPVQAPTRGHSFYGYFEKPPNLVAFYDLHGDTEDQLILTSNTLDVNVSYDLTTTIAL